jgi:tellurite resistance protein TerA
MNQFSRGQKGKLSDLGLLDAFTVTLDLQTPGFGADVSCFGLDAQDKLADDRYMVFYNQKAAPQNAITFEQSGARSSFALRLDLLPASIAKLVFTASSDDGTMRKLGTSSLQLGNALAFPFSGSDFQDEKALIVGELYRRDGVWRFGAVGQGFNGGLSALLKHFGGTEAEASSPPPPTPPVIQPAPMPVPTPPKPVSLSKITLEKRGDKISLEKSGGSGSFGRIRINLNWNQKNQAANKPGILGGLFGGKNKDSGGIDLDLGCLYELVNGRKSVVQALGDCWGNLEQPPYVMLDGDDRSGKVSSGENLTINGSHFDQIKRILVYAFIYDGVPNWAATDGVVTIEAPNQPPIEVRLDNGGNQGMCAIAMIENQGGKLQITKLVEYFQGQGETSAHELMDGRYQFGLKWVTGSKD